MDIKSKILHLLSRINLNNTIMLLIPYYNIVSLFIASIIKRLQKK